MKELQEQTGKTKELQVEYFDELDFYTNLEIQEQIVEKSSPQQLEAKGNTSSLCPVILASNIVLIKSDFSTNGIPFAIPYASMYSRKERTDMVVNT